MIVVEDACAAGIMDLHLREIEILNRIHCEVMRVDDVLGYLPSPRDVGGDDRCTGRVTPA